MGEFLKGLHHSATADVFLDAGVRVGGTAIECMPGADHPAAVVGRDDRRDRHKAAVIIARIGWVHLNSRMAPIIVMRAMKLSSGPWWATSPISSRSFVSRAKRWPVLAVDGVGGIISGEKLSWSLQNSWNIALGRLGESHGARLRSRPAQPSISRDNTTVSRHLNEALCAKYRPPGTNIDAKC
jgi:hypothetical protein